MHKQQMGSSLIAQAENDALRLKWRQSLTESLCRSLASDYLRGMIDECTHDAYLEYQVRWGDKQQGSQSGKKGSKKNKNTRYA